MRYLYLLGVFLLGIASAVATPRRVVTLAPSLAEMVYEIVDHNVDRIVGVSEFTNFPQVLLSKPKVGPFHRVNFEKIISLKPDLVVATQDGNPKDVVERIRNLGIPVLVVDTRSFKDILQTLEEMGKKLGNEKRAQEISRQLKKKWDQIRVRNLNHPVPKKLLLALGNDPLVVSGGGSFLEDAIDVIGAVNIYGDRKESYLRPVIEDVWTRKPDLIIALHEGEWKNLPQILSISLQSSELLQPGIRWLQGVESLEKAVWGPRP